AGAGDEPKLTQLLGRLEAVATLHLDRRRAELRGVADATLQEREEHLVARLAGRPDGRVNASAGRQHREVIGAAATRRELLPPLSRVAEMGVRVDEAGHDDAAKDIAVDHALDTRGVGPRLDLAPDPRERRLREVKEVHGDLRPRRVREHETLRLDRGEAAGRLTDLFRDPLREPEIGRSELDVEGDEEGTRADDDRAGRWMHAAWTEIRRVRRVDERAQPLVLRLTDVGEPHALRAHRGLRVEV